MFMMVGKIFDGLGLHELSCTKNVGHFQTFSHQLHSQTVINLHSSYIYLGAHLLDSGLKET